MTGVQTCALPICKNKSSVLNLRGFACRTGQRGHGKETLNWEGTELLFQVSKWAGPTGSPPPCLGHSQGDELTQGPGASL